MISVQEAKDIIQARFPEGNIRSAFEYKNRFYVFNVDLHTSDYENPFYAVSKSDGKLTGVSPFSDFEAFFDDADNHQIEV